MENVKVVPAERILEQIEGATIVSSFVEHEEGLHLVLQDGRMVVFAGAFCVGILNPDDRVLQ